MSQTKKVKRVVKKRLRNKTSNRKTNKAKLPVAGVVFKEKFNMSRPPRSSRSVSSNAVREMVCSLANPFCPKAKNSKWPDGMGGETLTMQLRSHQTLPTLGGGNGVMFYTPLLPFGALYVTSYTSPNYLMNASYSDISGGTGTSFSNWCNTYRVVSAGIVLRNILPALTAQGYVTISRQTSMPTVSSTIAAGVVTGNDSVTHPLVAGMEVAVVSIPTGSSARAFTAQNTTAVANPVFDVIKIEWTGSVASGTVLDVEYFVNVEFTLSQNNVGLTQFVIPSAPSAPHAITAAQKLLTIVPSTESNSIAELSKMFLTKAAVSVAELAGAAMFGL